MKLRTTFIIAGGLVLGGIGLLSAQVIPQPGPPMPIGCAYNTAPVTLTDGQAGWVQCTSAGKLDVNASVSASITGFPGTTPTTGTPISVTSAGTGVTGTLPAGTVVVASNVGTTNIAYCKLGATSTTSDQPLAPNGGWFAFTVGAATQLTCITSTSTTTVNMVGGAGIATGTGGGGGSGGGAVTVADGADVTLGAKADAACGTATGTCTLIALQKYNNSTNPVIAAGTSVIGYTSNDVCTQQAKTNLAISQNGTSSVQLIALSGSTVIYVCSLSLIAAGATTVAITTGTGSACVTGNAAVIGSTTANIANSMSLAANGGLTLGSGNGTIAKGAASSELCMILGTNVFVSGNLTYVQQ